MSRELLWIAVLAALYFVLKFRPEWMNRLIVAVAGKAVGRAALSTQPDFITPIESVDGPGRPEARSAIEALVRRGFATGGPFVFPEMPDLTAHFLAKPEDCAVAVVYEHARAGVWCDVSSRYLNGSSFTVTNSKIGGALETRDGHQIVRAPALTPAALHIRLMRERPAGTPVEIHVSDVPRLFAKAYADETAWRKGKGISKEEVRAVALEMEDI
jgi:hypothetical protein